MLLGRRADVVNAQNADKDTTMHLAVLRFRTTEAIGLLLGHGASMELRGRDGYTLLYKALEIQGRIVPTTMADGKGFNEVC